MIKDAKNNPVNFYLSGEVHPFFYEIPRFQREYVWRKKQWDQLFDDILENEPGHFLGISIAVNQSPAMEATCFDLIDGQQRFTTLSILLLVLYQRMKRILEQQEGDAEFEDQIVLHQIVKMLVRERDGKKATVLTPSTQGKNMDDFNYLLHEEGLLPHAEKPAHFRRRKLYRCSRHFHKLLDKENEELTSQERFKRLSQFFDKIKKAQLVLVEVDSLAHANVLFEAINNRGIPLTTLDLLKNHLLAAMDREPGEMDIDTEADRWTDMIDGIEEFSDQERLLRYTYVHFYPAWKTVEKGKVGKERERLQRPVRSKVIDFYTEAARAVTARKIWDDLIDSGNHYQALLENGQPSRGRPFNLEDLRLVGAASAYMLTLHAALRGWKDTEAFGQLVDLLVVYFTRRNLTDDPPTRDLDQNFTDLIHAHRNVVSCDELLEKTREFLCRTKKPGTDEDFREALEGDLYEDNSWMCRFILCKLEESHQTKESPDIWIQEKNKYVISVEHIFPQGRNIPEGWVAAMGNGNTELAKKAQEDWVHKLGNLTLTAYNSTLGNKTYLDKRDRKDRSKRDVGYRNGFWLNEDLRDRDSWDLTAIEERQEKLVEEAIRLFDIERVA
jgi:hypothetical protein